jgi:hypothetical protein
MPGTGTLRRSSAPARKKAIVGKSRVEATRLQRLSFVFLAFITKKWKNPPITWKLAATQFAIRFGQMQD